jgi:hypothetical protein
MREGLLFTISAVYLINGPFYLRCIDLNDGGKSGFVVCETKPWYLERGLAELDSPAFQYEVVNEKSQG